MTPDINAAITMRATAYQCCRGAQVLASSPHYVMETAELLIPTCMLIGHGLECYLKAFLLTKGLSSEELQRNPYGHDLSRLLDAAQARDIGDRPQLFALVPIFAEGHGRKSNYKYRYLKSSDQLSTLYPEPLVKALDQLKTEFHDILEDLPKSFAV